VILIVYRAEFDSKAWKSRHTAWFGQSEGCPLGWQQVRVRDRLYWGVLR